MSWKLNPTDWLLEKRDKGTAIWLASTVVTCHDWLQLVHLFISQFAPVLYCSCNGEQLCPSHLSQFTQPRFKLNINTEPSVCPYDLSVRETTFKFRYVFIQFGKLILLDSTYVGMEKLLRSSVMRAGATAGFVNLLNRNIPNENSAPKELFCAWRW